MAKSNKYDFKVKQEKSGWSAQITRRATAKKTIVSKSQDGFASESEAKAWGQKELELFLQNLKNRNQRHSSQRQHKADRVRAKAEAGSK